VSDGKPTPYAELADVIGSLPLLLREARRARGISCHRTFGGITGFDRHRRGGECLDPAGLGMHPDRRGVWRMDVTSDGPSRRHGIATADENGPAVGPATPAEEAS
jgi:hypothetical protein